MSLIDARTLLPTRSEAQISTKPDYVRVGRLWAVLFMIAPAGLSGQSEAAEVDALRTRLDEARSAVTHLIAPRAFARAVERLDDAARRLERGRADDGFRERLAEARASLADADRIAAAARGPFAETLVAREAAVAAEAATRAADLWGRAEAEFEDAGRRFERDDTEDASRRAVRAANLYVGAARAGWRDRHLGRASESRAAAVSVDAPDLAPETFADGERAFAVGEAAIADGVTGEPAASAGLAAQGAFEQAAAIATLADSVRRGRVAVERLLLAHESDLAALAQTAGVEAARGQPAEMTGRLAAEFQRLTSEVARLTVELAQARESSERLEARVSTLEDRLADSEQRFTGARDELLERRLRADRIREVQGLFTPEEAEVFLVGDRLVLRLLGLTFESGSANVLQTHGALLTKVQRVITTFKDASVRIEGHTDSRGQATSNQALSLRRAIAIREHLLARIPISSARVEAAGLGEEQPIASNETEGGRARNRRTEIVLTLPGDGG